MPFKIPRAILAPIWLIDRLRIDERTSRSRPLVVRIDIIHMHEQTRVRDVGGQRGTEPMFRRRSMKPNRRITRTDLAMDRLTFRVAMHAPANEAEGIDEEIVSRLDVLVSQHRNDSFEKTSCSPFSHAAMSPSMNVSGAPHMYTPWGAPTRVFDTHDD